MPFQQSGNIYRHLAAMPTDKSHPLLPAGTYQLHQTMFGFHLEDIGPLSEPPKVYGSVLKQATRIISTFNDRSANTGVLLSGQKGSGKTLLARVTAMEAQRTHNIPTVLVTQEFDISALTDWLFAVKQPMVIMFDEFEKTYDREHQSQLLTLLDGVFPTKKLFLLTCNDLSRVDTHMINRPGRIFYALRFEGLDIEFVKEYCEDTLNDKTAIDSVLTIAAMTHSFTFDMLQALVNEMNRYNESAIKALEMLNIRPDENGVYYNISVFHRGLEIPGNALDDQTTDDNPFLSPEMIITYNLATAYTEIDRPTYGTQLQSDISNSVAKQILIDIARSNGFSLDGSNVNKDVKNPDDTDDPYGDYGLPDPRDSKYVRIELKKDNIIISDPLKGLIIYEAPDDIRVELRRPKRMPFSYSRMAF